MAYVKINAKYVSGIPTLPAMTIDFMPMNNPLGEYTYINQTSDVVIIGAVDPRVKYFNYRTSVGSYSMAINLVGHDTANVHIYF